MRFPIRQGARPRTGWVRSRPVLGAAKVQPPPTVTTVAATGITQTAAVLRGVENPNGALTEYWWEWGITEGLGTKTLALNGGAGEVGIEKTQALEGLPPGTNIFYRMTASNSAGTTLGAILSFATEAAPISAVAVGRSYPPDKLGVRIDAPNGYSNRWAEDEHLAQNILSNIELEDEMPGGDKSMIGVLARDPQFNWQDIEPYAEMRVYNPLMDVFEGFLDKGPDVSGDQMSITPAALGYQAMLEDDMAQAMGFIDCDLQKWGELSIQERLNLAANTRHTEADVSTGFASSGASGPGIVFEFQEIEKIEGRFPGNEICYYGEGAEIGKLIFNQRGDASTPWEKYAIIAQTDIRGNQQLSGNYTGQVENVNQVLSYSLPGGKYAFFYAFYTPGAVGVFRMTNRQIFEYVKVIGNHNLEIKGTWPNIGFTMKQMVEYAIPRCAPPLEARPGDIDDDQFIISQAWYPRGPTSDMIHDLTKYSLYDWFVRGGKRFRVKQPGSYGNYWKAYVRESDLNEVGIDSQALWNEIVVSYTDVNGRTIYVGPPGSGCDVESELLKIQDPEHPANRAGRKRRDLLDMKGISNPAQAIEVGVRFLEEANLLNHAGSATLTGYVLDHNSVLWPASCVKSGDYISFMDAASSDYRKIVNRKYNHNNRGAEIDIDAPPSGMEQLLERLQSELISLGVN